MADKHNGSWKIPLLTVAATVLFGGGGAFSYLDLKNDMREIRKEIKEIRQDGATANGLSKAVENQVYTNKEVLEKHEQKIDAIEYKVIRLEARLEP